MVKGVVQHGEEKAGSKKVQNVSKSSSATEICGTAVPERIYCDCVVFAKQPAEKLIELKEKTWLNKVWGYGLQKAKCFLHRMLGPIGKNAVFA